jgi:hypothetical protein
MRQDISKKTQSDLKKKYQISFRRWLTNKSGGGTIAPYIGADVWFVREWVSERFLQGMNWNNYGDVWVMDHIVPLRLFDFSNEEDLKIALHYKNTMPLFKEDNLYKEGELFFSIKALRYMPSCEIIEKLKEILIRDSKRLDKYYEFYCSTAQISSL